MLLQSLDVMFCVYSRSSGDVLCARGAEITTHSKFDAEITTLPNATGMALFKGQALDFHTQVCNRNGKLILDGLLLSCRARGVDRFWPAFAWPLIALLVSRYCQPLVRGSFPFCRPYP